MWVRGLKLDADVIWTRYSESHPVWVRGLKRVGLDLLIDPRFVAPRVGAWIETVRRRRYPRCRSVAPRVGAWIETSLATTSEPPPKCRTPCGCVD